MKTRLALCVLLFGLSTVFVSSGTVAWLSDFEENPASRWSAGSVNISVDGQDYWSRSYHVRQSSGVARPSPEDRGIVGFPVENLGNSPVDVWERIANVSAYGELEARQVTYSLRVDNRWLIRSSRGMAAPAVAEQWIYLGRVAPGQTMRVDQAFQLRSPHRGLDGPNGGLTFDNHVLALQTNGAPNPVPELPGYGR